MSPRVKSGIKRNKDKIKPVLKTIKKNTSLIDLTLSQNSLDQGEPVSHVDKKSNDCFEDSLRMFVKNLRKRDPRRAPPRRFYKARQKPSKSRYVQEGKDQQNLPSEVVIPEENENSIIIVDDSNDPSNSHTKSVSPDVLLPVHGSKRSCLDDSIQICHETYVVDDTEERKKKAAKTSSSDEIEVLNSSSDDIIVIDSPKVENDIQCVSVKSQKKAVSAVEFIPLASNKPKRDPVFHQKNGRAQRDQASGGKHLPCNEVREGGVVVDTAGSSSSKGYHSPLKSVKNKSFSAEHQSSVYGNNFCNPNEVVKKGKRPVIIDGCNVAFGHGKTCFSTRGLKICIDYFLERGHWVVAFVPLFRRSSVSTEDRNVLDKLSDTGHLVFTPSRYLNGRCIVPYDDRYIVQCAAELGGVIVSTDNYRDLLGENEAWRETIEHRLLMFTWIGDMLMFPNDPNGRCGPRLEEFLTFPS